MMAGLNASAIALLAFVQPNSDYIVTVIPINFLMN